jgi:hypothetical protein
VDYSPLLFWIIGVVIVYARVVSGPAGREARDSDSPLRFSRVLLPVMIGAIALFAAITSFGFLMDNEYWPAAAYFVGALFVLALVWGRRRRPVRHGTVPSEHL